MFLVIVMTMNMSMYMSIPVGMSIFMGMLIVNMFHSENSLSVKYKVCGAPNATACSMEEWIGNRLSNLKDITMTGSKKAPRGGIF